MVRVRQRVYITRLEFCGRANVETAIEWHGQYQQETGRDERYRSPYQYLSALCRAP